jgi:hypothetical protein
LRNINSTARLSVIKLCQIVPNFWAAENWDVTL